MKRMITLALTLALTLSLAAPVFAEEQKSPFADVPLDHWAIEYIRQASQDQIIQGMGDGTFAPDDELTAAQFAAIVAEAFYWRDLDRENNDPWYALYQEAVEDAGLMEGVGVEDWSAPMTRYQMAQMLYNIAVGQSLFVAPDEETLESATIGDWKQVPEQYQSAVLRTYLLGLLSGMDEKGTFAGDRSLTRAQAAVIYCRLEEALLALQGPMERVLEKEERSCSQNSFLSTIFTRHPGKLGTAYEINQGGTPHGSNHRLYYVALDGTKLNIQSLLPEGYIYGSFWSLDPREVQLDEAGEKLSFVTKVQEQILNPELPGGFDASKSWGDTKIVINVVTGTTESMEPLTPVDLPEWSVTYRPDDPLTPTADLSMTLRNDGEAAGERPYIDGGGFPSSYMYVDAHQGGIRVYNEAGLFDEDFDDSEYGKAYHALIDLKLPDITHDNFSPVNTREQREQAGQYFQVLLNGVPVSGDLWWSQGNNHKDLNFTFDQPVALKYGDTLTLRLGMPQEEQT